jgi:hypothetical protein
MWLVKKLFDDKRCTVALLVVWMIAVCTIFYCLGAFHMAYMHVGPGEDTVFMGLKIDTSCPFLIFIRTVNSNTIKKLNPVGTLQTACRIPQ